MTVIHIHGEILRENHLTGKKYNKIKKIIIIKFCHLKLLQCQYQLHCQYQLVSNISTVFFNFFLIFLFFVMLCSFRFFMDVESLNLE